MKNIFLKYRSFFVILILITLVFYFFSNQNKVSNAERVAVPKPSFNNLSETLGISVINCEFKVFSDFSFKEDGEKDKLIKYGTSNQAKPLSIVFSGLDTKTPVMKGNNGEDPLLVISNTDNEISLASSNSFGDVFFYKIYKSQKVATWYKSYDMLGNPYALLSMGYCY